MMPNYNSKGKNNPNYRHGHRGQDRFTPEYNSWYGMVQRCTNPNRRYYHRYGGRGISVCERWKKFENFIADMGLKPTPQHSLDRIDNDGDYTPENCRWATQSEQMRNSNIGQDLTINGVTKKVREWGAEYGIPGSTIRDRLRYGWPAKDAVTKPRKDYPRIATK